MKQFKNAVAVAIAAAGLYSVSAMAGTAVHWAESDAGNAKDVKWQVVQPSTLDFDFTPADIEFVNNDGSVNAHSSIDFTSAGRWANNGDGVYIKAAHLIPSDVSDTSRALGDADGETLNWTMVIITGSGYITVPLTGTARVDWWQNGGILAKAYKNDRTPARDITDLASSRFTDSITVTKYTD